MSEARIAGVGVWVVVVVSLTCYVVRLDAANAAGAPTASLAQAAARISGGSEAASIRATLDKYCVTCHNTRLKTAGLTLDTLDVEHVGRDARTWEKVVRKLRTGSMPPAHMPRPDTKTEEALTSWLEAALDRAALAASNPGRPALYRLNRFEYTNAIRDLLGLEIDAASLLPADESGYGFDNIADVLSLSPGLLERYLSAARKISRLAIGDPTIRPVTELYTFPRTRRQDDRTGDDLPFGSRGMAIRHHFPLDGDYAVRVRLHRVFNVNVIRGLATREELDVRLDGVRVGHFSVGTDVLTGLLFKPKRSAQEQYIIEDYASRADEGLEVRFPTKAGTRVVGVVFLKGNAEPEGVEPTRLPVGSATFNQDQGAQMSVASVGIEGPFNAASPVESVSRRKVLICHPKSAREEEPCAKAILSTFARRAYRRPTTARDVHTLLAFYRQGRNNGGFEAGIRLAVERALVSPDFLFRVERDPANVPPATPYRISDLELASRLSFFLWSSIPDDELLELAEGGKLADPPTLERQVRRMVADPRASALVTNFAGQWLHLRNVRKAVPDPKVFPEWDDNLREALQRETELFLASQLNGDRSVLELLTANYTYLNERLARHYGMRNVYGSEFRRVEIGNGPRSGLLGHGSILTVTSYATRTSPVLRGRWLLENLLGAPPPPPPPNVPALREAKEEKEPTSVRGRLEQHRKNPACATCHVAMDPLGFALENFDAVGRWRTTDGKVPIDASGTLPDGVKFSGPVEFRTALLVRRSEAFVNTLAEKLLTYALGRGLEYYDMPAVRKIVRDAKGDDYRWSALIVGIIRSTPFQMKRSAES